MSLIQEALNRAQSKSIALTESGHLGMKTQESFPPTHGLEVFDQEIEKGILKSHKISPPELQIKKRHSFLYVFLAVMILSVGVYYWLQSQTEVEAVPPLIVSNERERIPPKIFTITEVPKPVVAAQISVPEKKAAIKPKRGQAQALFFLSGIAGGGSEPYAVVNGQILRAGEMVDNKALVESIESDHVILVYRGETVKLTLQR